MPKLELYKIAQKGDKPYILVPDKDPLDFSIALFWGDVLGKKTLSKALNAKERNEGLEVILQVGSKKELEELTNQDKLRDSMYDVLKKEESLYAQMAGGRLMYIVDAISSRRGFFGKMHSLFPILFILHGLPGFQPMVWNMLLIDPKSYYNCKQELISHYNSVEEGVHKMYNNIKLIPKFNERSLGIVNKIIKEDENGEGYNNAFRIAQKLTLPQCIIDHLYIATQSTEHTQWDIYKKVPSLIKYEEIKNE